MDFAGDVSPGLQRSDEASQSVTFIVEVYTLNPYKGDREFVCEKERARERGSGRVRVCVRERASERAREREQERDVSPGLQRSDEATQSLSFIVEV